MKILVIVLVLLIIVLVPAGLLCWLVVWAMRRGNRHAAEKAAAKLLFLGLPSGVPYPCTEDAGSPIFQFTPEKKQGKTTIPSALVVLVAADVPCDLRLRLQSRLDRWGLSLGLGRTLVTGDQGFDSLIYVEATSVGFAEDLLAKPRSREEITNLLKTGYQTVDWLAKTGQISATWTGYTANAEQDVAVVGAAAGGLEALLSLGAGIEAGPLPDWKFRYRLGLAWEWLVGLALVVGIGGGFYFATQVYAPLEGNLWHVAPWIIPFMLLSMVPVWMFFRATPQGHQSFVRSFWVQLVLASIAAYPVYFTLNGWLDQQPPGVAEVPVKGTESSRNKNTTTYYAVLDARIGGKMVHRIEVDDSLAKQIDSGGQVTACLDFGTGHFGHPWKKAIHFQVKEIKNKFNIPGWLQPPNGFGKPAK